MTFVNNLWRNEKSREIIIQLFVLLSIGWFLSWLVANVDANFKALGKDISFEFLFIPAGYDINQYLIDYNNCLLYTSPSPRDATLSRMPSSA